MFSQLRRSGQRELCSPGGSCAPGRVRALAEPRRIGYGAGMASDPIADYALLSDCRSAALVGAGGSVDWLCFPRFDSPSVFGRILGEEAGFWAIRPADVTGTSRRYVG